MNKLSKRTRRKCKRIIKKIATRFVKKPMSISDFYSERATREIQEEEDRRTLKMLDEAASKMKSEKCIMCCRNVMPDDCSNFDDSNQQICYACQKAKKEMQEMVDHPAHYGGADNLYEAIKVIEAWGLGFHLGSAVKYISRLNKKAGNSELQDARKCLWYVKRYVELLEKR